MTAHLCWWCSRLNDVANGCPCPCVANAGREGEVLMRHRASVRLARQHGWEGNARGPLQPRRVIPDPTGRRWAA